MNRRSPAVIFPLALAAVSLLSVFLGSIEFAGYDLSMLADSAWRWHLGQAPYVDYICTLPPLFYMLGASALTLFGVHWAAFTLIAALLFIILSLLGLWAIRVTKGHSEIADNLVLPWLYIAALAAPLIVTNHLWHSTMTSGIALYLFLATYLLYDAFEYNGHIVKPLLLHMGLAALLLFLAKPNIAWPVLVIVAATSLLRPCLSMRVVGMLSLSALLAAELLVINGIGISDVLASYFSVTGRGWWKYTVFLPVGESVQERISLVTFELLLAVIVCVVVCAVPYYGRILRRILLPQSLLALGAICVSVIGIATNWDIRFNDIGPMLLGMGLLILSADGKVLQDRTKKFFCVLLTMLSIMALYMGAERMRMQLAGPWAGKAYGEKALLSDPFFGSLLTRDQFIKLLEALDAETMSPAQNIFFGPRLEFMYARLHVPSPKHLPIWWHKGTSYVPAQEDAIVENWKAAHFDKVFIQPSEGDYLLLPPALLSYLKEHYRLHQIPGVLDIYTRTK